jgi:uncharacterized YigZ family protein
MSKSLPETIKTLISQTEFKLKEKGSLFHAISIQISTEDEIQKFLISVRKQFYDATHHCYSFKLHNGIFKYSDDGEPNGSAGKRIYNAQNHFELSDILTVVIRFFGGTKLGVGPLGKAYYDSAYGSFYTNQIIKKELYQQIEIEYYFSLSKTVHHLISKHKVIIQRSLYENKPQIIGLIRPNDKSKFILEATAISNQKIICKALDSFLYLPLSPK